MTLPPDYNSDPLHSAIETSDLAEVQHLLSSGADPNIRNAGGWTPLFHAVELACDVASQRGDFHLDPTDLAIIECLISAGADPNATSPCAHGSERDRIIIRQVLPAVAAAGFDEIASMLINAAAAYRRQHSPLNIAFLVGRFPQLSETFILNQVTGLIDRGQAVDIYARKSGEGKTHADFDAYSLQSRTYYRDMPRNVVARGLKAVKVGAKVGIKRLNRTFSSLNFIRYGKEASSLKLLFSLGSFCGNGQRYDIVHAHFGPQGLLATRLLEIGAINPDAKLVTTFYGYDVHRYPLNHGRDVYRPLFDRANVILTLSHRMKDDLIALGCNEKKLRVHHIGTNPNRFAFSPRLPPADGVVRLVSVARHVEKKGLEYAIRAMAKLSGSRRLTYDIIGDGPHRPAYEALIRELSAAQTVRLLGWKTQDEVAEILNQAHILLAPSVKAADGDEEGTPVALMEAMAMGLPVVSTHHAGIPEIVADGQNGYLVPERDSDALAEKILQLIDHPELWPAFGAAGRQRVEREFDATKLNDELVALYHSL